MYPGQHRDHRQQGEKPRTHPNDRFILRFTKGTTPSSMDAHTVIDTFFSLWVIGLNGDGFGMPSNYVYTSPGHKLDTKEGRELCEESGDILLAEAIFAHNSKITQVFQSGNILLHEPSNSNYCVSQLGRN